MSELHPLRVGGHMDNQVIPCIECGIKPWFQSNYLMVLKCPKCGYEEKNRTWGSVRRMWNYANEKYEGE